MKALLLVDWTILAFPHGTKLARNGQHIELQWSNEQRAFRVFVYKVTGRGERHRASERRIEITSTYQKNLATEPHYQDVVLGYDPQANVFVGIDPRRINLGGPTGNASSNVSPDGLANAKSASILIIPHESNLLGSEHQAYFKSARLSEYLANVDAIHQGTYDGLGVFSGNKDTGVLSTPFSPQFTAAGADIRLVQGSSEVKIPVSRNSAVWNAIEKGKLRKLRNKPSPSDLLAIYRRQLEIGQKGELHVLRSERTRLTRAKRSDLAARIVWASLTDPLKEYDILSYETDGRKRFIEVKASVGKNRSFEISAAEWAFAESKGPSYFIYRVTTVETAPATEILPDPFQLVADGTLKLTTTNWRIRY